MFFRVSLIKNKETIFVKVINFTFIIYEIKYNNKQMKSDHHSKNTESNTRTVLVSDEIIEQANTQGNIKFKFSNNTWTTYDLSTISSINPYFFSTISTQNQVEILLPSYITSSLLMEFLFIVKNGFSDLEECPTDNTDKILSLIKISEFFQNDNIIIQIITDIIMPRLNNENVFDYLQFSYEKLSKLNEGNENCDSFFFDLFYRCLEILGNDDVHHFINQINKIRLLDKKIKDELIQKCFASLIFGKYVLVQDDNNDVMNNHEVHEEDYFDSKNEETQSDKNNTNNQITFKNFESLIQLLYEVNQCNNYYDLLTREHMRILSIDVVKEVSSMSNPTFQIKIPFDFDNYYEEYPINFSLNEKSIIFVFFYKKSDDSFNIFIKIGDNEKKNLTEDINQRENESKQLSVEDNYCFKVFTFLTIVKISEDNNKCSSQTNLKSISNNKTMISIFKLTNFKKVFQSKMKNVITPHEGINYPSMNKIIIDNDGNLSMEQSNNISCINSKDFFSVTIYLKFCYIHSALISYLLENFSILCDDKKINLLSKQLIVLVIKNRFLKKQNENDLVRALLNWLNDESNIKEDISELFDVIKWEKVSEILVFEFIIKYSHMIIGEEKEMKFIKALTSKYEMNNNGHINSLLLSFIKAAHKVDYNTIYSNMKKNEKYNLLYLSINGKNNNDMVTSNNNNVNRDSTSNYISNDINGSTLRNKDCILNKTDSLTNYLLHQDLQDKIKNVSRNKKIIPLTKTKKYAKKMSHIKDIPNYGEIHKTHKNIFQTIDNHKNLKSIGNKNNRNTNSSNKNTNTEIMQYIKASKQKNNKKISRNKTINYLSCGLSYSNNKNRKIVLNK